MEKRALKWSPPRFGPDLHELSVALIPILSQDIELFREAILTYINKFPSVRGLND